MPHELDSAVVLGAFTASQPDLAAVLRGPVVARLSEFGTIRVEGADAVAFLQTQLTNDVANLSAEALQLNGYCTPKGRLLATFHQWRDNDAIVLQLPRELVAPVMKRLSMFVLRSKAKLIDTSEPARGIRPHRTTVFQGAGFCRNRCPRAGVDLGRGRRHAGEQTAGRAAHR